MTKSPVLLPLLFAVACGSHVKVYQGKPPDQPAAVRADPDAWRAERPPQGESAEVRFPKPVFHGDTIRVESEVVEVRASKSRPDNGIVIFAHRGYNQRNELVMTCKRTALMLRKQKTA